MKLKKVLIIGAGQRVTQAILPALKHLKNKFSVTDIYSRTEKRIQTSSAPTQTRKTITSLQKVNFLNLDIIIVAVTPENVPDVLEKLSHYDTKHITLFLDTPVLRIKHLWATRYLTQFYCVLVSEDSIALPNFEIAKKIITSNKIGKLKHIYLFYDAYKYHALALLKTLTTTNYVNIITRRDFRNGFATLNMTFPYGVTATLLEPRNYEAGKFLIIGEKGSIADYELKTKNSFTLNYQEKNNIYNGIFLKGPINSPPVSVLLRDSKIISSLTNYTRNNHLKIEGLIKLYDSFDTISTYRYSYWDALYDNFIFVYLEKFNVFIDVEIPGTGHSLVFYLIQAWAFLLRLRLSPR